MNIAPCKCTSSPSNYVCKKYKFKVDKTKALSIFAFFIVFALVIIPILNFEPLINNLLRSITQITWIIDIGMGVYFFGPVLLIWVVVFNLTETYCTVVMHEKYMDITLREANYSIKYRDISCFALGKYGNMWISLYNGTEINIPASFRLRIRDMISGAKFANALDKELKKLRR